MSLSRASVSLGCLLLGKQKIMQSLHDTHTFSKLNLREIFKPSCLDHRVIILISYPRLKTNNYRKKLTEQESIPVGCITLACADHSHQISAQVCVCVCGGGVPDVNRFEQVTSDGKQMPLVGHGGSPSSEIPCPGVGLGVPFQ